MRTLVDVFKMALFNEVKSQLFYRRAAEIAADEESRSWLRSLATMEEDHARQIAQQAAGSKVAQDLDAEAYIEHLLADTTATIFPEAERVLREGDVREVLGFAKEMELTARNTYEVLAEGTEDPAQRKLFATLGLQEEGHYQELRHREETLTRAESGRPTA